MQSVLPLSGLKSSGSTQGEAEDTNVVVATFKQLLHSCRMWKDKALPEIRQVVSSHMSSYEVGFPSAFYIRLFVCVT